MTGRRGRRCKQLLGDLKETRGYWKLIEEAAHCGELALEEAMDLSYKKMDELTNAFHCPEVTALVFQLHDLVRLQYCIIDSWV